jgi:hypothetical protein
VHMSPEAPGGREQGHSDVFFYMVAGNRLFYVIGKAPFLHKPEPPFLPNRETAFST